MDGAGKSGNDLSGNGCRDMGRRIRHIVGMRQFPPRRIVCLTEETVETLYLLGEQERIVGVSGYAVRPPQVRREKPRVSAFISADIPKILALEPDLVLAFSDLQKDVVHDLIGSGITVLCTNQRSFDDVLRAILLIGGAIGRSEAAHALIQDMRDEVKQIREYSAVWPDRPRVYFEEWHDPLIAGIRWVSELIEIAGGRDVFVELRGEPGAHGRIVSPQAVIDRDPEIILASWCGKPVDAASVAGRAGWDRITAVKAGEIHAIEGTDILSPGPSLLVGLRRIHEIIQGFQVRR